MMKVKAKRAFRGFPIEPHAGEIQIGDEWLVEQQRAYYLRTAGLADIIADYNDDGSAISSGSAYETWIAQPGNAGKTEAEFLASLKGEAGATLLAIGASYSIVCKVVAFR